ncbi:hypothetical protein SODALDRAFT_341202 [Sodiomyces alkalinus F11]|uniref:Mediator of RNA polymerase II transcription subunit 13 n=1 Tax=Sodiomyces alkalinus (strain CBS 110278 / VKM F-3762 / F11) TaxID=1314773 RepID=A0A3N2PPA4_SODAK|nr:hypothetical protein SODALDRAFT_341202 [Sodiomyces alkalinus F11]ROT36270.1 hypothetical protein SODALDRAFT_341202 [Sodiomyces alkalinus F11]
MDTSDYETNVFLITGISSISFQIYEPSPDQSQPFASIAPDLETTLQDEGRILHYDTTRRALWHFYIQGAPASASGQDGGHGGHSLGATLEFGGLRLGLAEEGSFEPVHLFKGRHFGPRSANTPTSSSSPGASVLDASLRLATSSGPATSAGPSSGDQDTKKAPMTMTTSAADGKTTSVTVKDAYEHFITATLATTSASFCRRTGAIPLNDRSVLLGSKVTGPDDREDGIFKQEMAVIGTFRVYLTTTGSLLAGLSLSLSEGLMSMNEIPSTGQTPLASQVLVAPFGVLGNYQGLASALPYPDAAGQTPDPRLWRVRPDQESTPSQWREACTRILRGRGLPREALQSCTWIALQLFRRRHGEQKADGKATPLPNAPLISWPSMLCFRKKSISSAMSTNDSGLGPHSIGELTDSLLEAKTWFDSDQGREEALAHRRKAREMAASRELQSTHLPLQPPHDHSPIDTRRAANGAAATAMYPTPPDGVQHPLGITPVAAVEGNISSPGAPSFTVAPVDADMNVGNTSAHAAPNSGQDSWDEQEARRERGDSFLEGDPVFDDMGGDMFGDADVTDADFSFFDDQPGDGSLGHSRMPEAAIPEGPTILHSVPSRDRSSLAASIARIDAPKESKDSGQSSPTFTKPELRHARSILNNDDPKPRTKDGDDHNSIILGARKRELSPFDPDTVFKKVRASLIRPSSSPNSNDIPPRKGSVFDGVTFNPELPLTNKKYEAGGRFDCRWTPSQQESLRPSNEPPTTDYLRRHGNLQLRRPKSDRTNALLQAITGHLENSTLHANPDEMEEITSDADDASVESGRMDSPESSDEPASPFKSTTRRLNLDDDIASYATSVRDVESVVDESDPSLALDLPRIAKSEAPEIAVTKYFEDPEPLSTSLSLSDENIIFVAQILTEQVISGTLHLRGPQPITFNRAHSLGARRQLASLGRSSSQALRDIISMTMGNASRCRLRSMIEVADVPLLGPPSRFQPRPVPSRDPNAEPPKPNNFYQIPPPHIEVKRLDTKLSILPSAVTFWDTMGLSPSQGPKDILGACIFPNAEGMSANAAMYLERIRHTYEFLKLGTFDALPGHAETATDGIVPWDILPALVSPTMPTTVDGSTLTESMAALNQRLLTTDVAEKNFVVFLPYIPSRPESIMEVCTAFQQLFEMYKKSLFEKRQTPSNELVLQLIPVDFLTSVSGMPTSVPNDLTGLAMEVYDRCTVFGGPMPAPAVVLEQSIPRTIDFRLSQTSSSSLMNENACMHIAYAQSIDERWITAAWTDNRGSQQMTASYSLGRKGKPLSGQFTDVANEIWETTHDLISRWKVHWRVIIAKCGHMEQSEMDFWVALAQTESQASISLTLITVDTDPSLQLIPPAIKAPVTAATSFYSTPVSTPQPTTTLSPEQSGAPATPVKDPGQGAATPGGNSGGNVDGGTSSEPAEGDAILIDLTDQAWGAILSHRLGNSNVAGCLDSALVSGYLIKRGGPNAEDPPVAMEVNIVHSDGHPRAHEALLREMLHKFRGLGTLARARGMVDRETDVRPWHIAAAEKGVRALYLLM